MTDRMQRKFLLIASCRRRPSPAWLQSRPHGPTASKPPGGPHRARSHGRLDDRFAGVRRKITVDDLPADYDTPSANNHPRLVRRPAGAMPRVLQGVFRCPNSLPAFVIHVKS